MKFKKTILALFAILLLTGSYLGLKYYAERKVREEIDLQIEQFSPYADVRYGKVGIGLIDRRVRIQNIQIEPRFSKDRVRVEALVLDQSRPDKQASPPVESIYLEFEGIRFDPLQDAPLKHLLDEMGYKDAIELNLVCSAFYDKKNLTAGIQSLRLEADDAGLLELRIRLENFNPDHIQNVSENVVVLLTMMSTVYIADAELDYKDDSLFPRLYEAGARRTDQSAESFRRMLAERVRIIFRDEENLQAKDRLEEFEKTIRDFILSPGAIHIQAKPEKPVSLLNIIWDRSPGRLIELLNAEAKNDPQIKKIDPD